MLQSLGLQGVRHNLGTTKNKIHFSPITSSPNSFARSKNLKFTWKAKACSWNELGLFQEEQEGRRAGAEGAEGNGRKEAASFSKEVRGKQELATGEFCNAA